MADYDEVFAVTPPIPKRMQGKTPPPDVAKPKRQYTRKEKSECLPENSVGQQDIDVEVIAEGLFEDSQLCSYHMVKSFFELCSMVDPKNHKRLAMILDGLISK